MDDTLIVEGDYSGWKTPPFSITFDCADGKKTIVFGEEGIGQLFNAFRLVLIKNNIEFEVKENSNG